MAVLGLHFCVRAFSSCGKRGPLFITARGPLTIAASLGAEHRLQTRRLSNCGSWAQLLRGMWDLPRPVLEPTSPALAGRFSTTAPPGKPYAKLLTVCYPLVFLGEPNTITVTRIGEPQSCHHPLLLLFKSLRSRRENGGSHCWLHNTVQSRRTEFNSSLIPGLQHSTAFLRCCR